ncbi:MAG TPA: cob(I)yrinic acid a,c-diamide adenosyltransferase [Candidatus Paceibacterota bacterium]|nr:cob(I)yrinic acid a,c-diamide adenosyltransferase [Candidatus Paceibacterota bacterium]HPT17956.1 cob(I)yrinic acid a,c-diamide adenosyltransferase [Candidatus Paceibacterota bacterium]
MLYTGKGDDGTTKTFGCDQRISKSSKIAEALGSLDEINSFLGICKVKAEDKKITLTNGTKVEEIVNDIQKNLFIVQAELAGASMSIDKNKLEEAEEIISLIEKELPPIKHFFISGGTELASLFDFARTVARRAERRIIDVDLEKMVEVSDRTKAYLNRLSSLLYALARLANHKSGITEEGPDYK